MSKPRKPATRDEARSELKPKPSFDDVVTLLKERRKYVDWIAALEAKRDQTPPHVYTRVHGDYEKRLAEVAAKLASFRGSLGEQQAALQTKLEDLDIEIGHHQDARAETELRAHVGELSAAALTEALRVADTEIEQLTAKRSSIESDLARVTEFFAAAEGTGAIPSTTKPKKAGGFDEMSFLESVVGEAKPEPEPTPTIQAAPPAPVGPVAESPAPPKPVEVPPTPPVEVPPPAPPRPTPVPPRPTPAPEPPPTPTPEPPSVPVAPPRTSVAKPIAAEAAQADGVIEKAVELERAPAPVSRPSIVMQMSAMTIEPDAKPTSKADSLGIIKTGEELPPSLLEDLKPAKSGGEKPFAANVASNNPLSLKSAGSSDLKTLKCKECGTMNDPSEWYCERCGAELSAI